MNDCAKLQGYAVTLVAGQCFVSKGEWFAELADLQRDGHLKAKQGTHWAIGRSNIDLISAWAKARGYNPITKKERHRVNPQTHQSRPRRRIDLAAAQRALSHQVPAAQARRRIGPA